jgi:hypothetical protein
MHINIAGEFWKGLSKFSVKDNVVDLASSNSIHLVPLRQCKKLFRYRMWIVRRSGRRLVSADVTANKGEVGSFHTRGQRLLETRAFILTRPDGYTGLPAQHP